MEFILRSEEVLNNAVDALYALELDEDEPFKLILKSHKKLRTEAQHGMYRSWLRIISEHSGDSSKALHVFYTEEFLPTEITTVCGKKTEVVKSTTELGIKDFILFLKQVEAHAASFFGVMLPHPGDLEW